LSVELQQRACDPYHTPSPPLAARSSFASLPAQGGEGGGGQLLCWCLPSARHGLGSTQQTELSGLRPLRHPWATRSTSPSLPAQGAKGAGCGVQLLCGVFPRSPICHQGTAGAVGWCRPRREPQRCSPCYRSSIDPRALTSKRRAGARSRAAAGRLSGLGRLSLCLRGRDHEGDQPGATQRTELSRLRPLRHPWRPDLPSRPYLPKGAKGAR
jgi:hypothetical protein